MRDIPRLAILVGANGTGKSALFSVFGFLRDAMTTNVRTALSKLGGSRGFSEVRSRNARGPIEIEIKYRVKHGSPLITYSISIGTQGKRPVVEREILRYRRCSHGKPWHFLDFRRGQGYAVTNEAEDVEDETQLERDEQSLKSPDLLAIKGLAQFERFPTVVALGNLIVRRAVAEIEHAVAQAAADGTAVRGRTRLVFGAPGAGKTALPHELARRGRARRPRRLEAGHGPTRHLRWIAIRHLIAPFGAHVGVSRPRCRWQPCGGGTIPPRHESLVRNLLSPSLPTPPRIHFSSVSYDVREARVALQTPVGGATRWSCGCLRVRGQRPRRRRWPAEAARHGWPCARARCARRRGGRWR